MSIEITTVQHPRWIETLVDAVVEMVDPSGIMGPFGYRWWEPGHLQGETDRWLIVAYPAPLEVSGGASDGRAFTCGFRLDVLKVLQLFSSVEQACWSAPARYNGALDGPELSIRGRFVGRNVWLRIFTLPPHDEPVTLRVDPQRGIVWEQSAQ